MGPWASLAATENRKNLCPCQKCNHISWCIICSLVTILTPIQIVFFHDFSVINDDETIFQEIQEQRTWRTSFLTQWWKQKLVASDIWQCVVWEADSSKTLISMHQITLNHTLEDFWWTGSLEQLPVYEWVYTYLPAIYGKACRWWGKCSTKAILGSTLAP